MQEPGFTTDSLIRSGSGEEAMYIRALDSGRLVFAARCEWGWFLGKPRRHRQPGCDTTRPSGPLWLSAGTDLPKMLTAPASALHLAEAVTCALPVRSSRNDIALHNRNLALPGSG